MRGPGRMRGGFLIGVPLMLQLMIPYAEAQQDAAKAWEAVVRAAKEEKRVNLIVPPGPAYRDAAMAFQKAHPGIQTEITSMHIRDLIQRIMREQQIGEYQWDVVIGAVGAAVYQEWLPRGIVEPLAPALILPEVVDDRKWSGGFSAGWMDGAKKHVYAFISNRASAIYVNRDLIPERVLPNPAGIEDLLHPELKGKIVWDDPREVGPGVNVATIIFRERGPDLFARLVKEQEVVFTRDVRQLVEWVVRGVHGVGVGLNSTALKRMQAGNVGLNVKLLALKATDIAIPGFGVISRFRNPPHPNAAKVFINWFLSREGQSAYATQTGDNSRRTDVPAVDAERYPEPGAAYLNLQTEEFAPLRSSANEMARKLIR